MPLIAAAQTGSFLARHCLEMKSFSSACNALFLHFAASASAFRALLFHCCRLSSASNDSLRDLFACLFISSTRALVALRAAAAPRLKAKRRVLRRKISPITKQTERKPSKKVAVIRLLLVFSGGVTVRLSKGLLSTVSQKTSQPYLTPLQMQLSEAAIDETCKLSLSFLFATDTVTTTNECLALWECTGLLETHSTWTAPWPLQDA